MLKACEISKIIFRDEIRLKSEKLTSLIGNKMLINFEKVYPPVYMQLTKWPLIRKINRFMTALNMFNNNKKYIYQPEYATWKMLSTMSAKPMSSMRSTSSRTACFSSVTCSVPFSTKSLIRPGVPTTTSTPAHNTRSVKKIQGERELLTGQKVGKKNLTGTQHAVQWSHG